MVAPPESPLRLRLRVTLKLMAALAAALALVIGLRYIGGGPAAPAGPVRVDVSGMAPGTARTLGWNDRPVIVLRRRPATTAALTTPEAEAGDAEWFVAFANGTANGCTIVWEPDHRRFRESCGQAAWDAAGRPRPGTSAAPLRRPPWRIAGDGSLVIGPDAP